MTGRCAVFVGLQILGILIAAPAGLMLLFASPSDEPGVIGLFSVAVGGSLASLWFARCAIRAAKDTSADQVLDRG